MTAALLHMNLQDDQLLVLSLAEAAVVEVSELEW
jgi:hypothetical protein